jgi:hypothetical protein
MYRRGQINTEAIRGRGWACINGNGCLANSLWGRTVEIEKYHFP